MRDKLYWISGPWPGRLAILPRPRGGDWLDGETRAWRQAGVNVAVSLLEPHEAAELELAREPESVTASGLAFVSFPTPDRGVPESREAVAGLVMRLSDVLRSGKNVGVHCRQGIGRSALIAAATLISAGEDIDAALRSIAHSRGVSVPETLEQQLWLSDFAAWFKRVE